MHSLLIVPWVTAYNSMLAYSLYYARHNRYQESP